MDIELTKLALDTRFQNEVFQFDRIEQVIAFLEQNPHCYWLIDGIGKSAYFGTSLMIDHLRKNFEDC